MKKTYAPILTLLISALGVLPPAAAALAQGEMAFAPAAQHLQEKNLLLVVAIVDGILLLSTVALALILGIRRRRHRLDRVLARSGRAYAPGEAGQALSPVMREVAALHAKGRAHGGICAAHMTLGKDGQIYLSGGRGRMPKKEAYALAPERREGGAATCPGDIYALGAVLQRMTVGENPLAQADPVIQSAMAQEPEKRPDIAALTAALGADEEMSKGRGQRGKAARIVMGCMGAVCVLALAASGVWAGQAAPRIKTYDAALTALAQGERETCQQYLQDLPEDYADVAQLKGYLEADALQEEERYQPAAEAFAALSGYRDAADRDIQCRTELIWYRLDRDNYPGAKECADALVAEGAPNAQDIAQELDYRYAIKLQDRFLETADEQTGLQAIDLLSDLEEQGYARAGESLEQMRQRIYEKAMYTVQRIGSDEDCEYIFSLLKVIDGYKDSSDYKAAVEVVYDPTPTRLKRCEMIMADYWGLEPIRNWIENRYLLEFLHGKWRDDEGRYLTMQLDAKSEKIEFLDMNLVSWRTYQMVYFQDRKMFGQLDEEGENVDLLLQFALNDNPDQVMITNEVIGKSYTLTRVK